MRTRSAPRLVVAAVLAAWAGACDPLDITLPPVVSVVYTTPTTLTFTAVGDTQSVTATVSVRGVGSSISGQFTWASEDTTVARVLVDSALRQHARVVAVGPGQTDIVVRFDVATPARLRVDVTPLAASVTLASREPVLLVGPMARRNSFGVNCCK